MAPSRTRRVPRITFRVACAQLAARPLARARAALRDVLQAIRTARRHGADLVVLPECSYPAYVLLDARPYRNGIPSEDEALGLIAREAARAKIDVCVGIAARGADGKLRNQAVYVDAHGRILGSYAKCRLWNFDHRWFKPGDALPVLATRFGPIGMMICADGRNPEIARTLAAQGAGLIHLQSTGGLRIARARCGERCMDSGGRQMRFGTRRRALRRTQPDRGARRNDRRARRRHDTANHHR